MTSRRVNGSLTHRLVLAQVAVIAAMTVTMVVAALVIGSAVFDQHMHEAGHGEQPQLLAHAQEAFRSAGLASMGAGFALAVLAAVGASAFVTRRIGRALDALARGADEVAQGHYDQPVVMQPTGRELDAVARTFNAMAGQIAGTEATRRRLLTDLSHEMRTPIAAIQVTLEAVEDGVTPLDDATLATLRAQTRRLERLATDLKDVSAAEEGRLDLRREAVDPADVVRAATGAAAAAYARQGVRLELDIGEDPPARVLADPSRLGQVVDNLLRNALQHCTAGDSVRIEVRSRATGTTVAVSDTGSGIAAEHLPHVFERFYRADPGRRREPESVTGTGVGLSISRAIVSAHGGTLDVRSDGPGRGATFTIALPPA